MAVLPRRSAQYAMPNASDDTLPPNDDAARSPIGWDVLVLLTAAGSASAAALYDATLAPVLIVVGLLCLIRLERIWRP